ncbi:MAG: MFS transporter [Alphaproteobacteria bacterium]|nr:MFS transporter [Alphaproteobacteria bacterium]
MAMAAETAASVPWWREPTRDQWLAWWAGWLGWTLDAFDFTVFLLLMKPIADEFKTPLPEVVFVLSVTLWLRLVGAVASGWLADRIGRKAPLMISILWYSVCNFIAGFSPTFLFLFVFRALLGIGMGAEWPAGAALAMESWPARSRGFMSGLLQGSWNLGYLFSTACYMLFFNSFGWRGMLWIGILPALAVFFVRRYVKEPPVWAENRRRQRLERREVRVPLVTIFRRGLLGNTLTACWWMASSFVVYYSINSLFPTYLQRDLHLAPTSVGTPVLITTAVGFIGMGFWGWAADRIGRRWSMILPALATIAVAPIYLMTTDYTWILIGLGVQGLFGQAIYAQNPSYLAERFPTEVRATAAAFCYHQGAIWGGFVPLVLSFCATYFNLGLAIPMLIGTVAGGVSFCIALLFGPETKGKALVPDLVVA